MKKKLLLVAVLALLCTLFTCSALAWDCEVDGHVERTTLGKEKTCTVDGYTSRYCTECGEITVEVYEIREATGHVWRDTPFKTTAATCNATGEERYMCKKCTEINVVTLPKDPSNHSDIQKDLEHPATCTEDGWYNLRCHGCAALVETNVETVPAKGHPGFQDWDTKRLPTCTEDGLRIRACKACTYVESEVIGSLGGHQYGTWSTTRPATCLQEGQQKRVCSVCKAEETKTLPMVDHTWGEWTTDKAPGCETPGTRKHTCTTCSRAYETEEIAPIGHTAGGYIKVKEATCQETGLMQGKCVRCSFIAAEEVLPALGHDFTKEVEVKVTCAQDGYTAMACSREGCEAVDEDSKKITQDAPMIHWVQSRVKTEGKTCLEDNEIVAYCQYCGYEYEPTFTPSGKHTWGEWKVMNCQSMGTQKRTCSTCGEVETEFIGYRAHIYDAGFFFTKDGEFLTHPDGTYVRRCDVCGNGDVYADWSPENVGNAAYCAQYGHGYDLVTEPDTSLPCTEKQVLTWKCAFCGDIKAEEAAFSAHDFSDWARYFKNTVTGQDIFLHCVKDGTEMRYCKKCGLEETRYTGTKNHRLDTYSTATEASCAADEKLVSYFCSDCRFIFITDGTGNPVDFPEKAYGHSYVTIPAVPATATTPGLTAGVQCEKCGQWKKAQFKVDANGQIVSNVAVLLTVNEETGMVHDSYGNEVKHVMEFWNSVDNSLDDLNNEVSLQVRDNYQYAPYEEAVAGDLIYNTDYQHFEYTYSGKTYIANIGEDNSTLTDENGQVIGRVDQVGNISLKLDGVNYTYVGTSLQINMMKNGNSAPVWCGDYSVKGSLDNFYANIENGEELRARVNDDTCIAGTIAAVDLHGNFDESLAVIITLNEDGMVCPECSYPMTQWFNWIADQMKCFCTNTNCSHVEYTEP
ncbi:MAG: hypothetical protein IJB69_08035 [Clostridia bacterium]|nr:hypothetical protein [Clostridia bacterium]